MAMARIELRDVRKVFHAGKPNEFRALDGITSAIEPNRATVLKGPSGSGKTTLLSVLGCMARPTSGRIFLGDREITSLPERFLTGIRRKTFGFVFQQFHLIKGLSALENVMAPACPLGEGREALRERASALLDRLEMGHRAGTNVEWLSGGEMQRVAIGRALINDPAALIADEPTAHLDSRLSREFMGIVGRLRDGGMTVIIASHDPLVYGSDVVADVIPMRDGRIVAGDAR